jgi:2-iminobutanoate/2-iminopropanoate deaminase
MRKPVAAEKGAKPKGPYSPAIIAQGPMVFVSAQGPFEPISGELKATTFKEQAVQVFENVTVQLEAAGATWADVVKVQVFLSDFGHFAEMNEIYAQYVTDPYPARTTVHSKIGAADIAVDCIAVLSSHEA